MTKYTGHIAGMHTNIANIERFGYKDETFTESTTLTIEIPGGITIHTGKPITITQEKNPNA